MPHKIIRRNFTNQTSADSTRTYHVVSESYTRLPQCRDHGIQFDPTCNQVSLLTLSASSAHLAPKVVIRHNISLKGSGA